MDLVHPPTRIIMEGAESVQSIGCFAGLVMKRIVSAFLVALVLCALVGFDFNQTPEARGVFESKIRDAVYLKNKVDVTLFATPLRVFGYAKSLNGNVLELTNDSSSTTTPTTSYVDISQIVILSVEQSR